MRLFRCYPYIYFLMFVFIVCWLPKASSNKLRSLCIGSLCPSWEMLSCIKTQAVLAFSSPSTALSMTDTSWKELEALKRENHLLKMQLDNIAQWFLHEERLDEQLLKVQSLQSGSLDEGLRGFYQRRQLQIMDILGLQMKAVPANVVYREPCSWSSFIWVNVGEKNNAALERRIIEKNSPVVIGNTLIGVIEEVGFARSKVRLITDAKLVPSVRAIRGEEQNSVVTRQIMSLLQTLQTRPELFSSQEEYAAFVMQLQKVNAKMQSFSEEMYLAKGELFGSALPLWRSRGQLLQGVGFNYDFSDEEGPARDLRAAEPLLQEGDLLITSGMDGVFPPGFEVALVTEVFSLQEGSSSYEIKAKALIEDFNEIHTVFILPPWAG